MREKGEDRGPMLGHRENLSVSPPFRSVVIASRSTWSRARVYKKSISGKSYTLFYKRRKEEKKKRKNRSEKNDAPARDPVLGNRQSALIDETRRTGSTDRPVIDTFDPRQPERRNLIIHSRPCRFHRIASVQRRCASMAESLLIIE